MERLTDSYGMYGIRYKQYLVVAKKEPYGNIVSVHEEAVLKAQLHRVYIIMYLASAKAFYQFDPEEVFKKGTRNYKGFAPMINFPIRMGRRTDWA